jgi:hypothetical protein
MRIHQQPVMVLIGSNQILRVQGEPLVARRTTHQKLLIRKGRAATQATGEMGGGRAGVRNRVQRARPGLRLPDTSTIGKRVTHKSALRRLVRVELRVLTPGRWIDSDATKLGRKSSCVNYFGTLVGVAHFVRRIYPTQMPI